jgi:type VI secretion system protein ImpA
MMPLFDLDAMLAPISEDSPSGPDLEYDLDFTALGLLARPTPGHTVRVFDPAAGKEVDKVTEGKQPDHGAVLKQALALLARSKDLRVAMLMLPAATRAAGLAGYAEVTRLVLRLCEQYWNSAHPLLDPDDDLDPTTRINIVAGYNDADSGMLALRGAGLADARTVGRFCVRDIEVAAGELGAAEGQAAPTQDALLAACQRGDPVELMARAAHVDAALADLAALEALFAGQAGRGPELGAAKKLLRRVQALYREAIGADAAAEPEAGAAGEPAAAEAPAAGRPRAASSRADARALLAQACDYLERAEPAHPAPLLVRRAIRLLDMNFLDIMRELATPEAVGEFERLGGLGRE